MRKWINIAEAVILVVMLVFVIGFHENNSSAYVQDFFMPKDFKCDDNLFVNNKSSGYNEYKWFVIGTNDKKNSQILRLYTTGDQGGTIQRIDPKSFLYELILSDKNKSLFDIEEDRPNYKTFQEFVDLLLIKAVMPIHFINSQTKEIEAKRNDLIVFWNEINKNNKYYIGHKKEIDDNNSDYKDYGYDLIFQNDKLYRIKFFRANNEGQDLVDFDYIMKSGLLAKSTTTVIVK